MSFCECCKTKPASQLHHKFSQVKWAKKLYGQWIHDKKNLQNVCADCHASHLSPKLERWTEAEFCAAVGIEPRSKTAKVGV